MGCLGSLGLAPYNIFIFSILSLSITFFLLEKIENGTSDQHEASFEVGKILREIYIDSAVRKGSKLEKNDTLPAPKREHKQLSWRDYKIMNEKFQDYHV